MSRPLNILTIGHSHIVDTNRAMWRTLAESPEFTITVAAPKFFQGDLRPLTIDPEPPGSRLALAPLDAQWTGWIHGFRYNNAQLRRLMREGNFDVVHAWEEPYIYAGYQIARSLEGLPSRFAFRTAQNLLKRYPPPFNYFERVTVNRAQAWIAGGDLVFETMLQRGYPMERGRIMSLAVDLQAFHPILDIEKQAIVQELGLKPPVLGFVGRLSREKGLNVLMKAIELLPRETPWSVLLLGSGPYKRKIQAWTKSRGLEGRVRVQLVPHHDVPRYLAAMDILLAPSQTTWHWREQFGRMIVEAFACGVPVIGSDSGEIPFVIDDAGLVVSENDPQAWASAILELLASPKERAVLSQRGLERVHKYSNVTVAAQFAEFYQWLAEQRVGTSQSPTGLQTTADVNKAEPQHQSSTSPAIKVLGFATQGSHGTDESRLHDLFSELSVDIVPFRREKKWASCLEILKRCRKGEYDLLAMEGTGSLGGLAVILARCLWGTPYVVSSGDAIAPFLTMRWPLGWPIFQIYEWLLYLNSTGFIGWTPYLTGRAITMGASRGMTAAGWAPHLRSPGDLEAGRFRVRRELGIPEHAIVLGICGSLIWSKRRKYCYGYELVQAGMATESPDVRILIVGDGNGRDRLCRLAGPKLGKTIFLPGHVPRNQVPDYLAAMDVGSLPQSVDRVGSFRYTTKLSEYFSVRLPIVSNQIPAAYDLDYRGIWRLPGQSPWDPRFIGALTVLMNTIDKQEIEKKRSAIPQYLPAFDRDRQIASVTDFVNEILNVNGRQFPSSSMDRDTEGSAEMAGRNQMKS